MKAWHIPDNEENRIRFKIAVEAPSAEGILQISEFKKWLQSKRYSLNTIKTYTDALKSFLTFYAQKNIHDIDNKDVIHFNNEYILKNNLSSSYQNQIVNAIKLYFSSIQEKK